MPGPLILAPVIAGAAVGVFMTLREAFIMSQEGISPSEEKKSILKGTKEAQKAAAAEPVEPA